MMKRGTFIGESGIVMPYDSIAPEFFFYLETLSGNHEPCDHLKRERRGDNRRIGFVNSIMLYLRCDEDENVVLY